MSERLKSEMPVKGLLTKNATDQRQVVPGLQKVRRNQPQQSSEDAPAPVRGFGRAQSDLAVGAVRVAGGCRDWAACGPVRTAAARAKRARKTSKGSRRMQYFTKGSSLLRDRPGSDPSVGTIASTTRLSAPLGRD